MSSLFAELKRRNVVRVAVAYAVIGWLVLQVSNTLVSMLELSESVNKFILLILLVAYIPMLLFSWVYELTPKGIQLEKNIKAKDSIVAHTAKRLDVITIVSLFGVIIFSTWQQFNPVGLHLSEANLANAITSKFSDAASAPEKIGEEKSKEKSIAVLPFVNISADADNEYFSDGISEEILAALAKVKQLKVVSRTSSFAFKDSTDDLNLIGDTLGVEYILEGSVRKAENTIRITAQLIQVDGGFHIWSETYDRELNDVFAIQDEIASHIVNALRITLTNTSLAALKDLKVDPDAYDLFLKGRHLWHQRGADNLRNAIVLYEQAVVIDPEFARAWAAMALATANMLAYTTNPAEELMLKAQGYAFRALALDPNQSEAIMVLPVLMAYERRWEQVLKNLDRAIELDPSNTTARIWKSESLWRLGYLDDAYREIEIAVTLDPSSPPAIYDHAYYALRMGDLNKATELAESVTTVAFKNASYLQALLAIEKNDLAMATELLPKAFAVLGVSEEDAVLIASGLLNPQKRSVGLKILDNVSNRIVDKRVSKFNVDIVLEMYKQYGAQDQALELSNRLVEDGLAFIDYSFWGLQNLSIRQHPAFRDTVQKRGFLEYWYLHGWPDECNLKDEKLVCS